MLLLLLFLGRLLLQLLCMLSMLHKSFSSNGLGCRALQVHTCLCGQQSVFQCHLRAETHNVDNSNTCWPDWLPGAAQASAGGSEAGMQKVCTLHMELHMQLYELAYSCARLPCSMVVLWYTHQTSKDIQVSQAAFMSMTAAAALWQQSSSMHDLSMLDAAASVTLVHSQKLPVGLGNEQGGNWQLTQIAYVGRLTAGWQIASIAT